MTVLITPGEQNFDGKSRSIEILTGSTSTTMQTVDHTVDVINLGMSTAATVGLNQYLLATDEAYEGHEVIVQATATGTASLTMTGTATGFAVFAAATDIMRLRQFAGLWRIEQNSGATFGTSTA